MDGYQCSEQISELSLTNNNDPNKQRRSNSNSSSSSTSTSSRGPSWGVPRGPTPVREYLGDAGSGFPPPPYYWVDCMHSACIQEQQQQQHHHHHRAQQQQHHHHHRAQQQQKIEAVQEFCRPPPYMVDDHWSAFGVCYALKPPELRLDADSCLYTPGSPPKSEFQRLFSNYVGCCMQFLDELSLGRTDGGANCLRKVLRLHNNLLHLLLLLRQQQQQQQVLQRLQQQLQRRRQAADALRHGLAAALQDMELAKQLASSLPNS
ncbi:hypothetical protein Esti_004496 [Eimeria stiedai]